MKIDDFAKGKFGKQDSINKLWGEANLEELFGANDLTETDKEKIKSIKDKITANPILNALYQKNLLFLVQRMYRQAQIKQTKFLRTNHRN